MKKIDNPRFFGVITIIIALLICTGAMYINYISLEIDNHSSYDKTLLPAKNESNPTGYINDDFSVDKNFKSHLPIVILDTDGVQPPISTYQIEDGTFRDIEGLDPYVSGTLTILNSGNSDYNYLSDEPETESEIIIKRRGNSSMRYEKAQWLIKLRSESGQERELDILSMGEGNEWVLNGTMADKSFMRNYIAYWSASQFMPFVPDNEYCEVLIKNEGNYYYNGIYLLGENISQGSNRVDIEKYAPSDSINSYIVRRDREDENAVMLNTFGIKEGLYPESHAFGVIYPGRNSIQPEMINYIEESISLFEKAIYSNNSKVQDTYSRYINVESFADYFILNEFFASYDSGNYSTYFYADKNGIINMGPVWDFDGTMDNYYYEPLEYDSLGLQIKPWFDRLCLDEKFISLLEERYVDISRGALSSTIVSRKIDEITAYLGPAINRDWLRWNHIYAVDAQEKSSSRILQSYIDEDGDLIRRNAKTFEEEILRIKAALSNHSKYIYDNISTLKHTAEFSSGLSNYSGAFLLLALLAFLIPAFWVEYKK